MTHTPSPNAVRVVQVDPSVYSNTAVLKAAYVFTKRAFLHVQRRADSQVEVRMRPKDPSTDPSELAGDFLNELIDQRLREIVAAETQPVRDLIVAHALSKTTLINSELEHATPQIGR